MGFLHVDAGNSKNGAMHLLVLLIMLKVNIVQFIVILWLQSFFFFFNINFSRGRIFSVSQNGKLDSLLPRRH